MNRKRIALLTGLTVLTTAMINTANPLKRSFTDEIDASSSQEEVKPKKKYPNASKELDLTSTEQYSSKSLFMNITLNDFYIKDLGIDSNRNYHLLLAPIKTSNQYFLVTLYSDKKIKKHTKITIQGFLNGKSKVNSEDIDAGINPKFLDKTVVTMMADRILS